MEVTEGASVCAPGFHKVELLRTTWEMPINYQEPQPLGVGAYGQVCSAKDTQGKMSVAVKKLSRPFQSDIHAKRAYREYRLLKQLCHENIISLLDVFTPSTQYSDFQDVYLVTDLMGSDLHTILKYQQLSDGHVQWIIYQILRGLKYLHSAGVIHRDLKPSNIAINEDCYVKILDFGLARVQDDQMTGYVATRWYRAPEVMLNWMHYSKTMDIWSVGCIMVEMLTNKILYRGDDYIHQLMRILEVCGTPSHDVLSSVSENARRFISSLKYYPRSDFAELFSECSPIARDLLEKIFVYEPEIRLTADLSISHEYFVKYREPNDEPITEPFMDPLNDNETYTTEDIRKLMFEDIVVKGEEIRKSLRIKRANVQSDKDRAAAS
ncbi:uncharacterized protein LOC134819517 [Bolinopsis microptera]|uniref:uncharacterized protein LOC134819517 n=1 Tax=Bolinopsis microptera TaxID=2820187 RepID=UPI00307AEF5A